jgi:bile acid:Na+ symporter, BASS family
MYEALDKGQLIFDKDNLLILNLSLAIIMFGIALDIKVKDFKNIYLFPKSFLAGLIAQVMVLPLLTLGLVHALSLPASVALGMFLVASCPGGNISNFLTHWAKGNSALSISLTAFSTIFAVLITPLNFALLSSAYTPAQQLYKNISLDFFDIFETVTLILALPLIIGIFIQFKFPDLSTKASKVFKPLSILIFSSFVIIAIKTNANSFLEFIEIIFVLVFIHQLLALLAGLLMAKIFVLPYCDTKTLTIETGIQNSGLALIIIFNYFDGIGSMAIIAAWWGIWHIISGFLVASIFRKRV